MKNEMKKNRIGVAIAVVASLLLVALVLLGIVLFVNASGSSISFGNIIGSEEDTAGAPQDVATVPTAMRRTVLPLSTLAKDEEQLTLAWWTGYDGDQNFYVTNMLPGDSVERTYKLSIHSDTAKYIEFNHIITRSSPLTKALLMTVTVGDDVLYEGSADKAQGIQYPLTEGEDEVSYLITVSLPTSAGNDVALLSCESDFEWKLAFEEPTDPGDPDDPDDPDDPVDPDPPIDPDDPDDPVDPDPPIDPDDPEDPGHDCCDCGLREFLKKFFISIPEACWFCLLCRWICGIFSVAHACICPWCCILSLLSPILVIATAIVLILYYRKKKKQQQAGQGLE